jgi:hypothetical protein
MKRRGFGRRAAEAGLPAWVLTWPEMKRGVAVRIRRLPLGAVRLQPNWGPVVDDPQALEWNPAWLVKIGRTRPLSVPAVALGARAVGRAAGGRARGHDRLL